MVAVASREIGRAYRKRQRAIRSNDARNAWELTLRINSRLEIVQLTGNKAIDSTGSVRSQGLHCFLIGSECAVLLNVIVKTAKPNLMTTMNPVHVLIDDADVLWTTKRNGVARGKRRITWIDDRGVPQRRGDAQRGV